MDTKLDKKLYSADGITTCNAVYLRICTAAVLIGRQAVNQDVSFGRLLHRLRKARDLTQEALAQQAYCAVDTIRKIEAGVRRPSRQLAALFADCLDLAGEERAAFLAAARAVTGDKAAILIRTTAAGSMLEPRSTLTRQSNLPAQTTSLIGRQREISAVRQLLRQADGRLITLTGPAGVGKTRLALQAAAEALDDFASGACFVALAPVSDPNLVIPTIAHTLGVREVSGQPLLETLIAFLRDQQLLLVLDNVEQVLDAAPQLAELLTACPQLTLLVTSRALLHLYGERTFLVPPLTLPARPTLPIAETNHVTNMTQSEAVQLFVERAQAAKADFGLTHANAPAVAEICARLDGLPLAIELAAARVRLFPPAVLLVRLSSRLHELTGGPRDQPARQQTLNNTLEWSYHLLDATEQILFRRLGVFVRGCTLQAAEAICMAGSERPRAVVDGITSLLDQSMLQQIAGIDAEPRYQMLETIREYASAKLAQSGDAAMTRDRHLQFFLTLAEAAEPHLEDAEQSGWLVCLEREHDNLRSALRWALERDINETASVQGELALQLAGTLAPFWLRHSHWSEGRAWLREALTRCPAGLPTLRAKALLGAATIAVFHHDLVQAVALAEQSLALYQAQNDQRGIANALRVLGMAAGDQGDYTRAVALTEECLRLNRRIDNKLGIADALGVLGEVACYQGDHRRATLVWEESLALAREMGDRWRIAAALKFLSFVALDQGDAARAQALASESLALNRELGDRRQSGSSLYALALAIRDQGDYVAARTMLAEAFALFAEVQEKLYRARALEALAGIAVVEGAYERAARVFGAAEAFCGTFNMPLVLLQRAVYERNVALVRAQLDAARLSKAWAEGRAMMLEQAVAYALEE